MHLHTVYMEYAGCLPTFLNFQAERTCFSQADATRATCHNSANRSFAPPGFVSPEAAHSLWTPRLAWPSAAATKVPFFV